MPRGPKNQKAGSEWIYDHNVPSRDKILAAMK